MTIDFTTLKKHTPFAQYEEVIVLFGAADTDTEIRHTLRPPTPEHISYEVIGQSQAGTVYHDNSGNRTPWREGVIRLRCSVASARVKLRLSVAHSRQDLLDGGPSILTPPVVDHEHDAADVTSGTFADALIPGLDASKITTGEFVKARQHAQTAYLDELIWQDYTPVWTQATTNPTLGNGTLTGRYAEMGDMVVGRVRLLFGSTTALGTGSFIFTLPVTAAASQLGGEMGGSGIVTDSGTAFHMTHPWALSTTTITGIVNGSGAFITQIQPMAWVNTDHVTLHFRYEKA